MYWFPPTRVKQSTSGTIMGPILPVRMRRSSFDFRSSPSGSMARGILPVPGYPTIPYAAGYRLVESYWGGREYPTPRFFGAPNGFPRTPAESNIPHTPSPPAYPSPP